MTDVTVIGINPELCCDMRKEDILSTIGGVNPPRGHLNWGSSKKGVSTKGEYGKAICNCKILVDK